MRVAKETTKYKMNWKVEFSRTNPFFVSERECTTYEGKDKCGKINFCRIGVGLNYAKDRR